MSTVPPFRSDNTAGVCPQVLEAIADANHGGLAASYGKDDLSVALNDAMSEVFERRCWCFPVSTGTAANGLALSAACGVGDLIACHTQAHILRSEDFAVQFFAGAVRLEPLPGDAGRIDIAALETFAGAAKAAPGRWSALSLTQLTEAGTTYGIEETASLAAIARRGGAKVHMDGARFANAVVALRSSPADLTWRRGIDILAFGATKNGTMNADAVVAFDPILAAQVEARLKRSGQLHSKMRFMAAQLLALLKDDLWLRNARHANMMAARLRERLAAARGVDIVLPIEGNHVFVRLEASPLRKLQEAGTAPWQSGNDKSGRPVYRLVTSFATEESEIELFAAVFTN